MLGTPVMQLADAEAHFRHFLEVVQIALQSVHHSADLHVCACVRMSKSNFRPLSDMSVCCTSGRAMNSTDLHKSV